VTLADYVAHHTTRGECKCGRCIDVGTAPDPCGLTVNVGFFIVAIVNDPTAQELQDLVTQHRGEFNQCNPFDNMPHSYIELGGWIGDQGLAMQFMALADVLKLGAVYLQDNQPILLPAAWAQYLKSKESRK